MDNGDDGQAVLRGKFEVPFIVRRNAHDGAGAVVGQDVVGDPDGHTLPVVGIDGKVSGGDAVLLNRAQIAGFAGLLLLIEQLIDLRFEVSDPGR